MNMDDELICERCGEKFFEEDASDEFSICHSLDYSNVKGYLCGSCACIAINNGEYDVYYEHCEKCGKEFDLISDQDDFETKHKGWRDSLLHDFSQILCCDCALEEDEEDHEDEEDQDDENISGENLTVEDAAEIWRSHGKDEDYMFGYTEEELEEALE
jgi:hypothetical protein